MQGSEAWRLRVGEKTIAVHPKGRFKGDSATVLAAAATAGLGLAYLPDFVTDPFLASGALVPVLADYPVPPAGIYVVRPPGPYVSRKVQVLIDAMLAAFGKASAPDPRSVPA